MSVQSTMKTKQELGFSDLLMYQTHITESVIEMKNGALLAGFWHKGPDLESATKEEVEALSVYISKALMRLGRGWMLHAEMIARRGLSDRSFLRTYKLPHRSGAALLS